MGKCCDHSSTFIFDWIVFILAGNKETHKNLYEIEFWLDSTTDCGVNYPCVSEKMFNVSTQAPSGGAVAWWLTPRTPDPEVGGSSPTRVAVLCP